MTSIGDTGQAALYASGITELRQENPEFQPIQLSGENELQIWGVVTGCIRKLRV